MALATLPLTTTVPQLRKHIIFTYSRLHTDSRGEPFLARFEQLQKEWRELSRLEIDLQDTQTTLSAQLESDDIGLDVLVDEVSEATTEDPALHDLLFKGKSPSVFKKPIAGVQLDNMERWEGVLLRSSLPAARALAPRVAAQVAKARATVGKRSDAAQRLREFYATAERRRFIEQVNVARMEVFTHFINLIAQEPALRLTQQYARSFFLATAEYNTSRPEEELSQVQERLEELRQELVQFEEREKELLALKEAQAQEEAQELAQRTREEELERELAALKALRAKKKR